jgi:hypothetical protein
MPRRSENLEAGPEQDKQNIGRPANRMLARRLTTSPSGESLGSGVRGRSTMVTRSVRVWSPKSVTFTVTSRKLNHFEVISSPFCASRLGLQLTPHTCDAGSECISLEMPSLRGSRTPHLLEASHGLQIRGALHQRGHVVDAQLLSLCAMHSRPGGRPGHRLSVPLVLLTGSGNTAIYRQS